MGQKISPTSFRLGIKSSHKSNWFIDPRNGIMKKIYPALILEDKYIRDYLTEKITSLVLFPVDSIIIERKLKVYRVIVQVGSLESVDKVIPQAFVKNLKENLKRELFYYRKQLAFFFNRKKFPFTIDQINSKKRKEQNSIVNFLFQQGKEKKFYHELLENIITYVENTYKLKKFRNKTFTKLAKVFLFSFLQQSDHGKSEQRVKWKKFLSYEERKLDKFRKNLIAHLGNINFWTFKFKLFLRIRYLSTPYTSASIMAKFLISQLEKRENTVQKAVNLTLRLIKLDQIMGLKIRISGRLDGVDMAEHIFVKRGQIPLSKLVARIDYCKESAKTLYGLLGVKLWIYQS